jgi:hypothetical protein
MDAKQKANEIFKKHLDITNRDDFPNSYFRNKARLNSHITVEQILHEIDSKTQGFLDWDVIDYWIDVKRNLDLIEC